MVQAKRQRCVSKNISHSLQVGLQHSLGLWARSAWTPLGLPPWGQTPPRPLHSVHPGGGRGSPQPSNCLDANQPLVREVVMPVVAPGTPCLDLPPHLIIPSHFTGLSISKLVFRLKHTREFLITPAISWLPIPSSVPLTSQKWLSSQLGNLGPDFLQHSDWPLVQAALS